MQENASDDFQEIRDTLPPIGDTMDIPPLKRSYNSEDKISMKYTWSNINVYYTADDKNLWSRFFRTSRKSDSKRHILKCSE